MSSCDPLTPRPPAPVGVAIVAGQLSTRIPDLAEPLPAGQREIYEVLRVHAGQALFLKEHLARFAASSAQGGLHLPSQARWLPLLLQLIAAQTGTQNIRLWYREAPSGEGTLYARYIPSHYPTDSQQEKGVAVGLLQGERPNPQVKEAGQAIRTAADSMLANSQLFEVLLCNHQQEITEGSRSNVLFIQESTVITPPSSAVLLGITRTKVLEAADQLHIAVKEMPIPVESLGLFEAAAILGTSPSVLPIARIAQHLYKVNHPILQQLRAGYAQLAKLSLKANDAR